MNLNQNSAHPNVSAGTGFKLPSSLVALTIIGMIGSAWWLYRLPSHAAEVESAAKTTSISDLGSKRASLGLPDDDEPVLAEVTPDHDDRHPTSQRGTRTHDRQLAVADDERSKAETTNSAAGTSPNAPTERQSDTSADKKTNPNPPSSGGAQPGSMAIMRTRPKTGGVTGLTKAPTNDKPRSMQKLEPSSYEVENQTIRDLYGKVVYKGTIDLKPTLDRIERGEQNRHRNDGTNFQNREGRLPRKAAGYYKEYVHPTPNENGPGPQRIIIGDQGEIWYTPDHYKSFKKIK